MRLATRQMHEVGGRAGQLGHRERAADRGGLGQRRPAGGEMRHVALAGGEQTLGAESDQVLVLGMNREQRTAVGRHLERAQVVARASLEALHHENLDAGDAAIDDARNLGDRLGRSDRAARRGIRSR